MMYHWPGARASSTSATAAAAIQGRSDSRPSQKPAASVRNSAVTTKSRPYWAGSPTRSPAVAPTTVAATQSSQSTTPLPSRNAPRVLPSRSLATVSAQFSSAKKNRLAYALPAARSANHGRSAAPIRTYRRFTMAVVVTTATTGIGSAQSSTATSWAAPASTVALISAASATLSPAPAATTPKTTP